MKLIRLGMIIPIFMLTGIIDVMISAVPLAAGVWAVASGLLGVAGLDRWLEKNKAPSLAKVWLSK